MIVTVDFDDCLCFSDTGEINVTMLRIISTHAFVYDEIHILTARTKEHEGIEGRVVIDEFIKEHNLPITAVHFTNHHEKGPFAKKIGSKRHYDDDIGHLDSVIAHGIEAYRVDGYDIWRHE